MKKNYLSKIPVLLTLMFFSVVSVCAQNRELVWSDEFDYTGLPDKDKWGIETGNSGWGNRETQFYTNREENVFVDNGVLTITARNDQYQGSSYTSARLTTLGLHAWKYGRIEARLKLPTGRAMWPAFWMLAM